MADSTPDGGGAARTGQRADQTDPEPTLTTERLLFEPLTAEHAPALFEPLSDSRLYRFIPDDPPASVAMLAERYRRWEARRSPDGSEDWLNWALRRRDHWEYIGTTQATVLADCTAFVAYVVFAPHQGQGYATEAVTRMVEHLFSDRGAAVIVAEIDTRNAASVAVVERAGFARLALKSNADFFKGASSDEYRYERSTRDHERGHIR